MKSWGVKLATLALTVGALAVASAEAATSWEQVDAMPFPASGATATVLKDGRVLVAGGSTPNASTAVAIFDPATNGWTTAAHMHESRSEHEAALLPDGRILVAGGTDGYNILSSAEVYDPTANKWTITGSLVAPRKGLRLTATPSGHVIVTGGVTVNQCPDPYPTTTVERYNPNTAIFERWGELRDTRAYHAAALLPSGKIMLAGGSSFDFKMMRYAVSSIEMFDPVTAATEPGTSKQVTGGLGMTLTPLDGTRVLVVPGCCLQTVIPNTGAVYDEELGNDEAWIYDTSTRAWVPTLPMNVPRAWHTATALGDGRVIVAGGRAVRPGSFTIGTRADVTVAVTEIFNPLTNAWARVGQLAEPRAFHVAAPVPNGIIVAGGIAGDRWTATRSTERYTAGGPEEPCCPTVIPPATGDASMPPISPLADGSDPSWSERAALPTPRAHHTAVPLPDDTVLFVGGLNGQTWDVATIDAYTPSNDAWTTLPTNPRDRWGATLNALPDGRVLVAGGRAGTPSTTMVDLYDPDTKTWSSGPSLSIPRSGHLSAVLEDRRVLVFGGRTILSSWCDPPTRTTELYDPVANQWERGPDMNSTYEYLKATVMADGRVLAYDGLTGLAEIFDPAADRWMVTRKSLSAGRQWGATLTALEDGTVLLVGGCCPTTDVPQVGNFATGVPGAEIFDPQSMTWTATALMVDNRYFHSASLLPSGRVLVTGGTTFTQYVDQQHIVPGAEIYDPQSRSWSDAGIMPIPRRGQSATLLSDGRVLVAGGGTSEYVESAGSWVHTFREAP